MNVQVEFEKYRSRFPRSYSNIPIITFYLQDKIKINQLLTIVELKSLLTNNIKSKDILGGEATWEPTNYTNRGITKSDEVKILESHCALIDNYRRMIRNYSIKKVISKDYIETLWY